MKRVVFGILFILVVSAGLAWFFYRPSVAEYPYVRYASKSIFWITKVFLKDTATILEIRSADYPHAIKIDSGAYLIGKSTGKRYSLKRLRKLYDPIKPIRGLLKFQLIFEPVGWRDTRFDLYGVPFVKEPLLADVYLSSVEEAVHRGWRSITRYVNPEQIGKIACRIKGKAVSYPRCEYLVLSLARDSYYKTYIPVRNGKFDYTHYVDVPELYRICGGTNLPIGKMPAILSLFLEEGTTKITYYLKEDESQSRISAGQMHEEYLKFKTVWESAASEAQRLNSAIKTLVDSNRYFTQAKQLIDAELNLAKQNEQQQDSIWKLYYRLKAQDKLRSPEAKELERQLGNERRKVSQQFIKQMEEHPTSFGFYQLYVALDEGMKMRYKTPYEDEYIRMAREIYLPQFSDSPYVERVKRLLHKIDSIQRKTNAKQT